MAGRFVAGKIQIVGLDEVVRELERRGADVAAGLEQICLAGAAPVHAEIAGRTESSDIEIVTETMRKTTTAVTVGVGPLKGWATRLARFEEFGTKPHEMPLPRKRKRKVMKLPDGGFRRVVVHPGTRKRPFIRPGYDASTDNATDAMGRRTKAILRA